MRWTGELHIARGEVGGGVQLVIAVTLQAVDGSGRCLEEQTQYAIDEDRLHDQVDEFRQKMENATEQQNEQREVKEQMARPMALQLDLIYQKLGRPPHRILLRTFGICVTKYTRMYLFLYLDVCACTYTCAWI